MSTFSCLGLINLQLVVVGDQSSGKSSLLESLTRIPFPRDLELCTRYATQITSRRDSESRVEVTIIPGPHASDAHKRRLDEYHPRIPSTEDFRTQFPGILKEVRFLYLPIISRSFVDHQDRLMIGWEFVQTRPRAVERFSARMC